MRRLGVDSRDHRGGGGDAGGGAGRGRPGRLGQLPGPRFRVGRVGRHGAEELLAERLRVGTAAGLLAPQQGAVRRVAGEVVGQGPADAEHRGQPDPERLVAGERLDQARIPLGDLGQAGQGEVRVGGRARAASSGWPSPAIPWPVMPRAASSRSALGTSAKPILASQPDREVRAPLTE